MKDGAKGPGPDGNLPLEPPPLPGTPDMPVHPGIDEFVDKDIAAREAPEKAKGEYIMEAEGLQMYFPVTKGLFKRKAGDVKAVDGVSFRIRQGRTLGVVGESGSGKSTLGNCVMRNLRPTGGKVVFDGQDVTRLEGKALAAYHKRVTMVTQDPFASLDPRMTVADSVLEGVRINRLADKAGEQALAERMLLMVGLNPKYGSRYPHEFSGGQRQRVSIARALAMGPSFIICDEVVSALDVSVQAQVVGLLQQLQQQLGLSYIFIGHDLSVVRYLSHEVAVMYLGKFMEVAGSDELYGHPLHPYTQALVSAAPIPKPSVDRARPRVSLEGEPPSPIHPPQGCRFCTRCRYAEKRCREEEPALKDAGGGHLVACHKVTGG